MKQPIEIAFRASSPFTLFLFECRRNVAQKSMAHLLVGAAKKFMAEKVGRIKKPEAKLIDVDLQNISRDSVTLNSKISVKNPYSLSLPVCALSYSLKSVDRVILSGRMADPGSLAGNQVTVLEVPVKVPYDALVSLAKDIGSDWDIDYVMEVGLIIDLPVIGDISLPLTKSGHIKLPTFSDILK